ncbi:MAG: zinc-ribbon domain-containing protein [Candidatus Nealsonbacteria bacterium]|nr:zinc-ribbon domain-containing protein [Candidatus Nealsonbacteria bacterium]
MANFCPKCGVEVNLDDKFCKSCGANLAGPVEAPKEQLTPEKTPVPVKTPTKYIVRDIIKACIQIFLLGLILYFVWYSYNCAVGNYPNTGDQMCKYFYETFKGGEGNGNGEDGGGGNGGNQVSIGCQHCSPGYCWTEGHCCPNSTQYYCKSYCYRSSSEAYNAGCHQSSWTRWCCP